MKKIHLRLIAVLAVTILTAYALVMTVKTSVVDFARVSNESMLPYLTPYQLLIIAKFSPCVRLPLIHRPLWCGSCEKGHAYVLEDPRKPGRQLVKFAVDDGTAGEQRATPQLLKQLTGDIIWFTQSKAAAVKPGAAAQCRFEGSNREHSVDSRHFGPVPVERVLGKVVFPRVYYAGPRDEPAAKP